MVVIITCPAGTNGSSRRRASSPITASPRSPRTSTSAKAPGSPDDVGARVRAAGGVPDDQVVGDVAGAMAYLRAQPNSNGKVGVIGFCSGGRHAYLDRLPDFRTSTRWSIAGAATWSWTIPRRSTPSDRSRRSTSTEKIDRAAARHLRQRRREPERRSGQPHRSGAEEARQELRVPPLRRRRPRLLQPLPRVGLSRRAGRRRLEEGVRLLQQASRLIGLTDQEKHHVLLHRRKGQAHRHRQGTGQRLDADRHRQRLLRPSLSRRSSTTRSASTSSARPTAGASASRSRFRGSRRWN